MSKKPLTNKELIIQDRILGLKNARDAVAWMADLLAECKEGECPTPGNRIKLKVELRCLERALFDTL